jgi:hypothetical protein
VTSASIWVGHPGQGKEQAAVHTGGGAGNTDTRWTNGQFCPIARASERWTAIIVHSQMSGRSNENTSIKLRDLASAPGPQDLVGRDVPHRMFGARTRDWI